jgi:hypothetical protein
MDLVSSLRRMTIQSKAEEWQLQNYTTLSGPTLTPSTGF